MSVLGFEQSPPVSRQSEPDLNFYFNWRQLCMIKRYGFLYLN